MSIYSTFQRMSTFSSAFCRDFLFLQTHYALFCRDKRRFYYKYPSFFQKRLKIMQTAPFRQQDLSFKQALVFPSQAAAHRFTEHLQRLILIHSAAADGQPFAAGNSGSQHIQYGLRQNPPIPINQINIRLESHSRLAQFSGLLQTNTARIYNTDFPAHHRTYLLRKMQSKRSTKKDKLRFSNIIPFVRKRFQVVREKEPLFNLFSRIYFLRNYLFTKNIFCGILSISILNVKF